MGKRAKQYAWMKDNTESSNSNKKVNKVQTNYAELDEQDWEIIIHSHEVFMNDCRKRGFNGIVSFAIINCRPHIALGGLKGHIKNDSPLQSLTCDYTHNGTTEKMFVIVNASAAIIANYCNMYKVSSFIHCTTGKGRTLKSKYYTKQDGVTAILRSVGDALTNWNCTDIKLSFTEKGIGKDIVIEGALNKTPNSKEVKVVFNYKEYNLLDSKFLYAEYELNGQSWNFCYVNDKPQKSKTEHLLKWLEGRVGLGAYAIRCRLNKAMGIPNPDDIKTNSKKRNWNGK